MADKSNRRMVQTMLNLQSPRGQDAERLQSPYFIKRSHSDAEALEARTEYTNDSGRSHEMEDIQPSTQTTTTDSTTTSSTDTSKAYKYKELVRIAAETTALLPNILATAPHAPPKGYLYSFPKPPRLRHKYCPNLAPTAIRIINGDTLDTAIGLAQCAKYITVHDKKPVCVLNMANARSAGGGWKRGALAQEEALCYRSSLSFTLKLRYYPMSELAAIYSPTVLVMRESMQDGHTLLSLDEPEKLPVVSVVSVAALCMPNVHVAPVEGTNGQEAREQYSDPQDRELMKEKMRVVLRSAAVNGHRRLVLGALGCGAFLNPREEVADCWAEVFGEQEFSGGWWESVIFAVMDDLGQGEMGDGNYGVFFRRLNGMMA